MFRGKYGTNTPFTLCKPGHKPCEFLICSKCRVKPHPSTLIKIYRLAWRRLFATTLRVHVSSCAGVDTDSLCMCMCVSRKNKMSDLVKANKTRSNFLGKVFFRKSHPIRYFFFSCVIERCATLRSADTQTDQQTNYCNSCCACVSEGHQADI